MNSSTTNNQENGHIDFIPALTPQQDFSSSPTKVTTNKTLNIRNTFSCDETNIKLLRGQVFNRKAISTLVTGAVYSAATIDYLIGITSLSYAPSIGLPSPKLVGIGKTYIVKDEAGGAATTTITVRSAAEETIDGASTATITTNYQAKSFYSDGANWFIY